MTKEIEAAGDERIRSREELSSLLGPALGPEHCSRCTAANTHEERGRFSRRKVRAQPISATDLLFEPFLIERRPQAAVTRFPHGRRQSPPLEFGGNELRCALAKLAEGTPPNLPEAQKD